MKLIRIKVMPGSKRDEIIKSVPLVVKVRVAAERGEAPTALHPAGAKLTVGAHARV